MATTMAQLKACTNCPFLSKRRHYYGNESTSAADVAAGVHSKSALVKSSLRGNCLNPRNRDEIVGYKKWVVDVFITSGYRRGFLGRRASWACKNNSTPAGEVGFLGEEGKDVKCGVRERLFGYLVSEYGWGVRRLVEEEEEMRKVAQVQAEAFHTPTAFFNHLFFEFFQAEVLAALIYKIRNSPPNRYACLVAEPIASFDSFNAIRQGLVGVVDVTVQRDEAVLRHLDRAEEYLYVSGIAVLKDFRRQKVATVLLKACDHLSLLWSFDFLALWAYEDDSAARKLYTNAGYRVASEDPIWITWIGRKRRVLMIKQSGLCKSSFAS